MFRILQPLEEKLFIYEKKNKRRLQKFSKKEKSFAFFNLYWNLPGLQRSKKFISVHQISKVLADRKYDSGWIGDIE